MAISASVGQMGSGGGAQAEGSHRTCSGSPAAELSTTGFVFVAITENGVGIAKLITKWPPDSTRRIAVFLSNSQKLERADNTSRNAKQQKQQQTNKNSNAKTNTNAKKQKQTMN
jgi:hypothetical protein